MTGSKRLLLLVSILTVSFGTAIAQNLRNTNLGLLDEWPTNNGKGLIFVDLGARDPVNDVPYLFKINCSEYCPFKVGYTYKAVIASGTGDTGIGAIWYIFIDQGKRKLGTLMAPAIINPGPGMIDTPSNARNALTCNPKLSTPGGHWESSNFDPRCVAGRQEVINWIPDDPSQARAQIANDRKSDPSPKKDKKYKNLPRCIIHPPHSNWDVKVVIDVQPASGKHWNFSDAPSVIARRFLEGMNDNTSKLRFLEPNGDYPNFTIHVTLDETNDGTRRDQAWASVVGPYEEVTGVTNETAVNFTEKSGEAPYLNWQEAIDHLSRNVEHWWETGWSNKATCLKADGSVLQR